MPNDTPPDFKQDVPDEVLLDLLKQEEIDGKVSPTRRYLVTMVSQQARNVSWIIQHEKEKGIVLDEIKANVIKTNGRVTKLEDQVAKLEADKSELKKIKDDIKVIVMLKNLSLNKYFWAAVGVFMVGAYTILVNAETIRALPIFKMFFGS